MSVQISMRVSKEQKEKLVEIAKQQNKSLTQYVLDTCFVEDVDNIRSIEIDLLKTAGWELGATVISALVSGGIGALGAITSVASVVGVAQQLPPVYDRALGNYKKCQIKD